MTLSFRVWREPVLSCLIVAEKEQLACPFPLPLVETARVFPWGRSSAPCLQLSF